jgi:hypothetical protein
MWKIAVCGLLYHRKDCMLDRTAEHLAWMHQDVGCGAGRKFRQLFKSVPPVEAQDPELFDLQAPGKWSHVSRDQFGESRGVGPLFF